MFEEIFFPPTAERYRAAPLAEQRERYLTSGMQAQDDVPYGNAPIIN